MTIFNFFIINLIILLAFLFNFFIYAKVWIGTKKIQKTLRTQDAKHVDVSEIYKNLSKDYEPKISFKNLENDSRKINKVFDLYISITSIFPLLGILGTVLSFIKITDFTYEIISNNFSNALSSTLFGLSAAIFFKVLEGIISGTIEDNNYIIDFLLKNNFKDEKNEKKINN